MMVPLLGMFVSITFTLLEQIDREWHVLRSTIQAFKFVRHGFPQSDKAGEITMVLGSLP
jgi:hypothetical protein